MEKIDVIRAWKDKNYRKSLNDEELKELPSHPAGLIELPDTQLNEVFGAQACDSYPYGTCREGTWGCCNNTDCGCFTGQYECSWAAYCSTHDWGCDVTHYPCRESYDICV